MSPMVAILLYTTGAGLAIWVGGLAACIERIRPFWLERELRHGVLAFGGGVLLSAVALVLVPEGIRHLSVAGAVICLLAGGALLLLVDSKLARSGTPMSMLLATLLDFAPEAVALGALIPARPSMGPLLALLIALQNLPEGFNACREMVMHAHMQPGKVLWFLLLMAPVGPLCGIIGLQVLAEVPVVTGSVMMLASGGILYLTFQDIAPQARLDRHWGPPFGAVLGFGLGLAGRMLAG